MALPAAAILECRSGGSNLNSGGFVPGGGGTDRTLSNSAFVTFDGVTITATTSGVTTTILITGYTVVSGDVDNYLRIASGTNFTAGLYRIVSVNTGANTWTLDRNATTGVGAAMVGRMGGAIASLAQAILDVVGGNTCYFNGTFTQTSSNTWAGDYSNEAAHGVIFQGYSATRGDNGQATFTTATNSVDIIQFGAARRITFRSITFSSTAGTRGNGLYAKTNSPAGIGCENCIFDGLKQAILGDFAVDEQFDVLFLRNCEVKNCTTNGIVNDGMTVMWDCNVHDNTGDGFRCNNANGATRGGFIFTRCIFSTNSGRGINAFQQGSGTPKGNCTTLNECIFYNNTSDGARVDASANQNTCMMLENNIFYGNGGFGFNSGNPPGVCLGYANAFGSNSSGAYNTTMFTLPGEVTLTGNPFTNAGSGDFSLNSTAGAGAACKAVGFPGILLAGGTGYIDIGALQSQASGGGTTIVPNKTNYIFLGEGE